MISLCNTCKHFDLVVLVGNGARVIEECYFPANNKKVGNAKEYEEYEAKETNPS